LETQAEVEPASGERTLRVFPRIAATLLIFAVFEGLIFHTRLYPSIIEPDSTTGSIELRLHAEARRLKADRNQVLAVGNSRMSFLPRLADAMTPPTGYTFGSVAAPGTNARCWYYLLRAADPTGQAYAAILIATDDYDELDQAESLENRPWDLHYMLARLQLRDLVEFAGSHSDTSRRVESARGILLKGFVYKRDFQELLLDPPARYSKVGDTDRHWAQWAYDYTGSDESLAGLEIDWQRKVARYPERFTADQRRSVEDVLLRERPPDAGRYTAYYRYWYGRILDHYRGSDTRIIFLRLPRGPVPPPEHASKPDSAVRQLASRANVILLDEHLFDSLERPELFGDPLHLNRPGMEQFAPMLANAVRSALGPPRH
jgi:hypothetical protein